MRTATSNMSRGLGDIAASRESPTILTTFPADLAAKLLTQYDLPLGPAQQARCDYAVENADERGPCCCQCWRWQVYGGLAKQLITEHDFSRDQIVEVWNLSDGCGGCGDHFHP